ncbi:MAG TPA: protein-L-isoaspartate O-methyltransferase [Rhodocyclaceae bacterium]
MDFDKARFNMVEQQIRPWEVLDPTVLGLLMTVRREDFVPTPYRQLAFADVEIPLSDKAVMLAPKIEAKMLQDVGLKSTDRVLEIGTGSGYMAALLASLTQEVTTVEIDRGLAEQARKNLEAAGIANVRVELGDGLKGWPAKAPYDVVVVSGGVAAVPEALFEQLKPNGRLIAIVGTAPLMRVELYTRDAEGAITSVTLFETETPMLANASRPAPAFAF